jgi:hypothetical protein
LFLQKGVRGASPGRGLGLWGGGATGRPFLGWQFTNKKNLFLIKNLRLFFAKPFLPQGSKTCFR